MSGLMDLPQELLRLAELKQYQIVLGQEEAAFSELASVAAQLIDAPMAGVSLVDDSRVWLKGRFGVELESLAREGAFCSHAVASNHELFEVPDARLDTRFNTNPLVREAPKVRYYAAATLIGQRGYVLGTLWIMDLTPRMLSQREKIGLLGLAAQAVRLLDLRYRSGNARLPSRAAFVSNLQCALNQTLGASQACRVADCSRLDRNGLCTSQGSGKPLVVGFIQLRNLSLVYSTLGRERGSKLFDRLTTMLIDWCGRRDMLAHVDGDHFAFALFEDVRSIDDRLSELESVLSRPVVANGDFAFIGSQVGIVCSPAGGANASALLDQAATAATQYRDSTMTSLQVYERRQQEDSVLWMEFQKFVADNIRQRRLLPHYQAQVDVSSGRIVGFEALCRMQHPEHGLIGPPRFLEIAGTAGLLQLLDMQILESVCRDIAEWRQLGLPVVPIAVNLSRATLMHTRTIESMLAMFTEFEVPTGLITVEITETGLAESTDVLNRRAQELHHSGVGVALDDFGTGLSNLHALRSLHFDCLKIDRLYVHGAASNPDIGSILQFTLNIAEMFGVRLVCEGVEDPADLQWAMAKGCRYFQGWYFSRAVDKGGVASILRQVAAPGWVAPAGEPAALAHFLQSVAA